VISNAPSRAAHALQPRAAGHQVPARLTEQPHAAAKASAHASPATDPAPGLAQQGTSPGVPACGHRASRPASADGWGRYASAGIGYADDLATAVNRDGQGSNS
jgi:hypothetical protein